MNTVTVAIQQLVSDEDNGGGNAVDGEGDGALTATAL